jgi:hypothetical protein
LETNNDILLRNIQTLKYRNGKFYIKSLRGENPLDVFNVNGTYYGKIGKFGRGPEEILNLVDFLVEEDKITLFSTRKTFSYALDGEFLEANNRNIVFSNFLKLNDNLFALHFGIGLISSDLFNKMGGTPSGVVLVDSSYNILSDYDIRSDHRNRIGYQANFFSEYKSDVLYRDNY